MNRLHGIVAALESEGDLSLVEIDAGGIRLSSLVLDSVRSAAWLAPGSAVTVLFKESEVALAAGDPAQLAPLSIRNRLPCAVRAITAGRILAHIELECGLEDEPARGSATLHALISARACAELGLAPGMAVTALIKATEVSLAEGHAEP